MQFIHLFIVVGMASDTWVGSSTARSKSCTCLQVYWMGICVFMEWMVYNVQSPPYRQDTLHQTSVDQSGETWDNWQRDACLRISIRYA